MQLAASQRAHPPPVPPRPSRQLVAEALKKSPRPPCPTRQAPPPPNQRPWRLEEHPRQQPQQPPPPAPLPQEPPLAASGRTLVYESPQAARQEQPGREEKRRSREAKSLNGREQKDLEETRPSAEAPGRGDEESKLANGHKGNDNAGTEPSNGIERDTCDGPKRGEARPAENSSAERRRKKPALNVSFKDEDQPDKSSGDSKPASGTKIERQPAGATVVVIDEIESPRAGSAGSPGDEPVNIKRQDWLEAGVRYSSTKITLPAGSPGSNASEELMVVNGCASHDRPLHAAGTEQQQEMEEEEEEEEAQSQLEFGDLDFSSIIERIAMSSLQGLPPLPRSLSGFNLNGAGLAPSPTESTAPPPPPPARSTSKAQQRSSSKTPSSTSSLSSQGSARPSPPGRQLTTLDTQLAILRREMFGLRQLDLSLLSQLWSLNESIQEFRQLLQEQEDRAPSPSPSSEEGDDTSYSSAHPPPPPRRPAPTTPHRHQQQHHYRSSRSSSSRSSKLPPSDESPSSEEYGAV